MWPGFCPVSCPRKALQCFSTQEPTRNLKANPDLYVQVWQNSCRSTGDIGTNLIYCFTYLFDRSFTHYWRIFHLCDGSDIMVESKQRWNPWPSAGCLRPLHIRLERRPMWEQLHWWEVPWSFRYVPATHKIFKKKSLLQKAFGGAHLRAELFLLSFVEVRLLFCLCHG